MGVSAKLDYAITALLTNEMFSLSRGGRKRTRGTRDVRWAAEWCSLLMEENQDSSVHVREGRRNINGDRRKNVSPTMREQT